MRKRIFHCCCLALAIFALVPGSSDGDRVGHEGDEWLKMTTDVRQAYVTGFSQGFTNGLEDGCLEGTKGIKPSLPGPENDPLTKCLNQIQRNVDLNSIAKMITTFYTRFPSDRYLYIEDVMGALLKGMTLDEIHKHATPAGILSGN